MDFIYQLYNDLIHIRTLPLYLIYGVLGLAVFTFGVQLWYYLGVYGGLPRFRNNRGIGDEIAAPPVSVIVVVRENNYYFIEHTLPLLLAQEYDEFEVVVVDCSYNDEIGNMLGEIRLQHSHMHLTQIRQLQGKSHSIKLAITIGIKAARYEHMLLTTADSYPASRRWVSMMAKGFITGDVVLGYCGIEPNKGIVNALIRCSRLFHSIRYLAAATRKKTYRGISNNIGYTQTLYFNHRGFNHLNMNIGDDDLFIRELATPQNVSVVMNPKATMRQIQQGGLKWWATTRKYFSHAFRYYPAGARFSVFCELWSRFIFFATAFTAIAVLPHYLKAIPALLVLIRLWAVISNTRKIARRLGERKVMWAYLIYDLFSPLSEGVLYLSRVIAPNSAIWR